MVSEQRPVHRRRPPLPLQSFPGADVPLYAPAEGALRRRDRLAQLLLYLPCHRAHDRHHAARLRRSHGGRERLPRQQLPHDRPRIGDVDQPPQRAALGGHHQLLQHALGLLRRVHVQVVLAACARQLRARLVGGARVPQRVVVPQQVGQPRPLHIALGREHRVAQRRPSARRDGRQRAPDGVRVRGLDGVVVHGGGEPVQRHHRADDEHQPRGQVDLVACAQLAQLLRDLAEAALLPAGIHRLREDGSEGLLRHVLPHAPRQRRHRLARDGVHPDRRHLRQQPHDLHVLHQQRPLLRQRVQNGRGHRLLLLRGDPGDEPKVQ
mmetsp:Transcript_31210/g.80638  ORF Transcript_31210/g.80638 Transcript_31210/m.80638 type:complete len:322 (+) Transcript_31210:314-1279(+)